MFRPALKPVLTIVGHRSGTTGCILHQKWWYTLFSKYRPGLWLRTPAFAIKKLVSAFARVTQWKVSDGKLLCGHSYFRSWPHCMCICRIFPFRPQNLWEESIQTNHTPWFIEVCSSRFTDECNNNKIKGHVLILDMAGIVGRLPEELSEQESMRRAGGV